MSDAFIRMVKEELHSSKCTSIVKVRLDEIEELFRKAFYKLPLLSRESRMLFLEAVSRVKEDIELLSRLRVSKVAAGSQVPVYSFDSDVLSAVVSLIKLEELLLSPFHVKHHDKVLTVVVKDCVIDGERYRKGELVLLSSSELVEAFIQGCVEPLENPLAVKRSSRVES